MFMNVCVAVLTPRAREPPALARAAASRGDVHANRALFVVLACHSRPSAAGGAGREGRPRARKGARLRLSVEPQALCGGAALEPESPASGAYQHSQRAAVVVRSGLHGCAQAGDAVIQLAEFDQAIAEIHAGTVMPGIVCQHAP